MPDDSPLLARAFAHNDSARSRPLLDALEEGFSAIEIDLWLWKGKLVVGHDLQNLSTGKTLEDIYLKPLLARAQQDPEFRGFTLLLDVKSEADPTYKALHTLLEQYREILTSFIGNTARESAITVIISGNRPYSMMKSQATRYAAYDGRIGDLGRDETAPFMPMISAEWGSNFKWKGKGEMPPQERRKLHDMVGAAHAAHQRLRFWRTPEENDAVWKELVMAGVDYINTDRPATLPQWLRSNDPHPFHPETPWLEKPDGDRGHLQRHFHTAADRAYFRLRRARIVANDIRKDVLSRHWRLHVTHAAKTYSRRTLKAVKDAASKIF